jgi:hypothetical protein
MESWQSGLMRTVGSGEWVKPSGVRILYSPFMKLNCNDLVVLGLAYRGENQVCVDYYLTDDIIDGCFLWQRSIRKLVRAKYLKKVFKITRRRKSVFIDSPEGDGWITTEKGATLIQKMMGVMGSV